MCRFLILLFFLFVIQNCDAQSVFKGMVWDEQKVPIGYANAQLLAMRDSAFVVGGVSDEKGEFCLQLPDTTTYILKLSCVGYEDKLVELSHNMHNATFTLRAEAYNLSGVTISARRRMVKSLVDRYQIDVACLKGYSFDMMDLLAKTPGVIVENGTPSIIGKSGFRIMVNNRMQRIEGSQAVAYLKSLDMDNVDKIEVIQNPPAKYEAEGDYGIIHIITKKPQTMMGCRLSEGISEASGYWTNDSYVSTNVVSGKLSLFAMTSLLAGRNQYTEWNSQDFSTFTRITDCKQINHPQNYNVYAGVDYAFTKQLSLGGNFSWYEDKMKRNSNNTITTHEADLHMDSVITSYLDRDMPLRKRDATVYVSFQAKKAGVELSGSYFDYDNHQDSQYRSYLNKEGNMADDVAFFNNNTNHVKGASGMADFNFSLSPVELTLGGKITYSKTPTSACYEPKIVDYDNKSTYEERIYAFYAQAMSHLNKKLSIKVGFRYEATHTTTILTDADNINRKYENWFPNMFFSYRINDDNSIRLSYSGSIQRPNLQYISPFVIYSTTKDYASGNPYLKPLTINRLGLDYTFMGNLLVGLYYSVNNNMISQIIHMDEESRITESKWENGKCNKNLGLNVIYYWNQLKWLNAAFMAFGSYVNSKSKTSLTKAHSEYGKAVLMANLNFMMNASRTWTCGLNARYSTAEKNCDQRIDGFGNVGCYTQVAMLKKKLTANLSFSNLLEPKMKGTAYSNGKMMHFSNSYSPFTIKLALAYTLGVTKKDKTQGYGDKEIKNRL